MTCAHVLGLIDAGRFADYPQTHLDAAWQHAHECATCGRALNAAGALTRDLATLPQPGPPPEFAATVFARIAHAEQAQPRRVAVPAAATKLSPMPREWSASAAALGGLAAGLVMFLPTLSGEEVRIGITSSRVGGVTGLLAMPATITDGLVLGAGLVVYAAGLFAPLRGRS